MTDNCAIQSAVAPTKRRERERQSGKGARRGGEEGKCDTFRARNASFRKLQTEAAVAREVLTDTDRGSCKREKVKFRI